MTHSKIINAMGIGGMIVIIMCYLHGMRTFVVSTGSMSPEIPVGSLILVYPAGAYHRGDVITYRHGTKYVTHRIISVKPAYQTKGDGNSIPDSYAIPHREIVGKVIMTVPWTGFLIAGIHMGFACVVGVLFPTMIILVGEVRAVMKEVLNHENSN